MTHFINIALIAITLWVGFSFAWTAFPILLVWIIPSVILLVVDAVWGVDDTFFVKLPCIVWAPGALLIGPVIALYCVFDGEIEEAWGIMSNVLEVATKPLTPIEQTGAAN